MLEDKTLHPELPASPLPDAAHHDGRDPDRVSFTATLRIVRQTIAQPGAFPPSAPA